MGLAKGLASADRISPSLPAYVKHFEFQLTSLARLTPFGGLFGLSRNDPAARYAKWLAARRVTPKRRAAFVKAGDSLAAKPVFSIIIRTCNSPLSFVDRAVRSVAGQTYGYWELCITCDESINPKLAALLKSYAANDTRIKLALLKGDSTISVACNAALELARGDYFALLDEEDELAPHALYAMAAAINKSPDVDWLYSDEDKIDDFGRRTSPFFKPDWSPAFFLGTMYVSRLAIYRRQLAMKLGGFRLDFDQAEDYDIALRFARATKNIVHVPDVLYSRRNTELPGGSGFAGGTRVESAACRALQDFIDTGSSPGRASPGPVPGSHKVDYQITGAPLVSIAIPSAGRRIGDSANWMVLDLVRTIRAKTTYSRYEIVVAENKDFDPALRSALDALEVRRVLYEAATFNIADKMNLVVEATKGDYVVLLNDDMSIINDRWLAEMLMWCQQDGIAGVGAKLFFPTNKIQHAGVIMLGQGPSHIYYNHEHDEIGQAGGAVVPRDYSAVTGACLMVRRDDYIAIGGFDPAFRINYNDVDFCLRLKEYTGGHFVYTPYAQLYHYESVSREPAPPSELQMFNVKWADYIGNDPFYNCHLSQASSSFEINPSVISIESQYGLPS